MPRKQHIVRLTGADRKQLQQIVRHGRRAANTIQRTRILLQTDAGRSGPALTDVQVARAVDCSARTVARVRVAWCTAGWAALERKVRRTPPTPPKLNSAQEARLIAIACSQPPDGYARWSLRLLADRAVELEVVDTISRETVRRTLKNRAVAHVCRHRSGHDTQGGDERAMVGRPGVRDLRGDDFKARRDQDVIDPSVVF
jgi:transposase